MTLDCFTTDLAGSRPIYVVAPVDWNDWLDGQTTAHRQWLLGLGFEPKPQNVTLLPAEGGGVAGAVLVVGDPATPWDMAAAYGKLPAGLWRITDPKQRMAPEEATWGWALAAYRFDRYRRREGQRPLLYVDDTPETARARVLAEAVWLGRDLVNTPANDMGPQDLQAAIQAVARENGAACRALVGEDLLTHNFPAVHAVGRASAREPRLVELTWGNPDAPKLTLVGKGVCFDTGGLDIKPSSAMLNMKKDMGGAALTTALAQAVMGLGLEVRLRLLVPAVENSISGAAFRPGDVLRTRKGLTVEIGNTDAEGRLVLADALAEADDEGPDLLIDAATLTGAARVALGPDLPALFTPDDGLAEDLLDAGRACHEPLWRLPLHAPYRKMLESRVADINNTGQKAFAGAVTAALFLQEFVSRTTSWAHLDIFAWNDETRPGRPKGGEATALRPLVAAIERRLTRR